MAKTVHGVNGWIVCNEDGGRPLMMAKDGLLIYGEVSTIFPNKRAAELAIEQTRAAARKHRQPAPQLVGPWPVSGQADTIMSIIRDMVTAWKDAAMSILCAGCRKRIRGRIEWKE